MGLIALNGAEREVPGLDWGRLNGAGVECEEGGVGGCVMAHPDSYGQSHTQPEKIFHTPNFFHPIKLSINYFNPQIKDSKKCLMFIC